MITVKLQGGMGNQMFQAAYGMALKAHGYDVVYDRSHCGTEGVEEHHHYSLGYWGDFPEGTIDRNAPRLNEDGFRFNPNFLYPPKDCTLVGYWQTEKYFEKIADKVRQQFVPKEMPNGIVYDLAGRINSPDSIGIHVRRTDYLRFQHFHGMPGMEYYREAVRSIRADISYFNHVYVFSDDRSWCKENFPSEFTIVDQTNKYEDMWLMSLCNHAVIANSTFSWWAAWLGDRNKRNRIVVAPKQWFTDKGMQEQAGDVIPPRWRKV